MLKPITALLATAFLTLAAVPTVADELGVEVGFSAGEISIIRAYYRDQGHTDHGRKTLPPGIAKNLQRGKALPPGIAKQALPSGLVARLPAPPKGFDRIEVAGKILLIEVATQVIHDVLEDAVLGK